MGGSNRNKINLLIVTKKKKLGGKGSGFYFHIRGQYPTEGAASDEQPQMEKQGKHGTSGAKIHTC